MEQMEQMDRMEPGAGMELYVYYRVPADAAAQARQEVLAAHAALRAHWPSLTSRCLQRTENREQMLTWMEIHHQPGGLDAAAVDHICAMLRPWPTARVGDRHVELFAALPASGDL